MLQGVETLNLRAGTYVVSWEGSSTCEYSLNTAAAASQSGQSYTSVSKGGTIVISSVGSNNLWLRFSSDLTNLTKVMLIQGTQTSAFVARQHASELALCQRYFQLGGSGIGASGSATGSNFVLTYATTMRATPSVSANGPLSITDGYTADYVQSSASAALISGNERGAMVLVGNFSGLTGNRIYFTRFANANAITFSAEL